MAPATIENLRPSVETTIKAPEGLVDVTERRRPTVPKEVETWLTKLETDPEVSPSQQADPSAGAQVAQIKQNLRAKTKLGVKRSTFIAGFGQGVANVARWLSTYIFRLFKKHNGEVEFEKEEV